MIKNMLNMADLKTEESRLNYEIAKKEYEKALSEICTFEDLITSALKTRYLMLQLVSRMQSQLLEAIDGEFDETRVHYLMTDAMLDLMRGLAHEVECDALPLPAFAEYFKRGAKPRDLLTVSQWSDRNRWLQSGTNSPGRWNTALTPYLKEIMDSLSEHSPVRSVTFIKSSGVGGPLALDTPIATLHGWTTMGEITEKDIIFDENGNQCDVTYVSPVFEGKECFEITFSDGAKIISDADHRWEVKDRYPGHEGKKHGIKRENTIKTTGEMADSFISYGRRRFSINVALPLQIDAASLSIPPYVLGYWLGNGNLSGNQMTAHEDDVHEIAENLTLNGWKATARKMAWDKGRAANIILDKLQGDGFLKRIRLLGINQYKRIPAHYLRASEMQRMNLLQGLMDADGSTSNMRCEYSSTSEALANDVMELLYSLGYKPVKYAVPRMAYSTNRRVLDGNHYRISFKANIENPVFQLKRKISKLPAASAGFKSITNVRYINNIVRIPSVPVRCIAVSSPSHLYLAGREMIPTHNTEAMNNWLGYVMHHLQNKDLLVVVPTLELRDRSFNPRLAKMIDESEVLAELVSTASRSKTNRGDLMEYGARSRIIKAGANSPDSLRSDHLPYVICDEVDAFPWDVGGEGDPMTLIENRQRTFSRAKSYFVSTPTNDQASRIEILFKRSDMRRYHVPCPHCGEFQTLKFGGKEKPYGLKFRMSLPKDDEPSVVESCQYLCEHCGVLIDEGYKTEMLAQGRWLAERPSIKANRGYHLNALYAPIGLGLGWKSIAEKWLSAQNDTSELKAFINTYLGEVFKEDGEEQDPASLIMRLEVYNNPPIAFKTAGVDVQKDRLEASIVGWGKDEECWLIDHIIIPGDTAQPHVWDELHDTLADSGIKLAAVDSGYNTSMVYDFCEKRKWTVAIKGVEGLGRPLIEDEKKRRARLRVRRKRGVHVEPLGVDQGKALIYSRLKQQIPAAGYIHFPQEAAFDDEYFNQLTAEKLILKIKGTRPFHQWVKTRARNEALDCLLYAMAAMRLLAVDLSRFEFSKNTVPVLPSATSKRRRIVRK
ncbi:MAG: phage terminase large subunit family protein [Sulfuritalea sp.]|nr:phage terminase large subunit family protein [Sulfuritalea sp.]